MKILILSSLSKKTGCWLRAGYLANGLAGEDVDVKLVNPLPALPCFFDMILAIPVNLIRVLCTRCDVVIGLKPFPNVTIPLLLAKLMGRLTVVDIDDLDYGYRTGMLRNVVRISQGALAKYAHVATYHNEKLRVILEDEFNIPQGRIYRLKQGVDFQLFDKDTSERGQAVRILTAKYGLVDRKVMLYTAHLNAACDLGIILEALAEVVREEPEVLLLVIGGGERLEEFTKQSVELGVADYVVFTGHQKNTDTVTHLMLGDIALLYYADIEVNEYRCSMKLREYLAMGKTVVCNSAGELTQFDKVTIQASDDTADAFSASMLYALRNDCSTLADLGYEYARREFDWNVIGAQFVAYLKTIKNT